METLCHNNNNKGISTANESKPFKCLGRFNNSRFPQNLLCRPFREERALLFIKRLNIALEFQPLHCGSSTAKIGHRILYTIIHYSRNRKKRMKNNRTMLTDQFRERRKAGAKNTQWNESKK